MGVKIAIIGTHCTGKTTLMKQLVDYLKSKGKKADFVKEVVRDCPFPVNEKTTVKAQDWIIKKQIEEENKKTGYEFLVCDRSVLDCYAYLFNLLKTDHKELYSDVLDQLKTYDVLFLTKIKDDKIEADGFRSTDQQFRIDIERIMNNKIEVMMPFFNMSNVKIIKINSFDDIKNYVEGLL